MKVRLPMRKACCGGFVLALLAYAAPAQQPVPGTPPVDFSRQVRPILAENCFKCHGPDAKERRSRLRLDDRAAALKPAASGRPAIVPGKPADSSLVERVFSSEKDVVMPPPKSGKVLTAGEKALLKAWVEQGAPYEGHWAFIPPVRPGPPAVRDASWVRNEIDAFILNRLEKESLKPTPEADRATLIRRLSLDLTGLPPAAEEVDRFLNDAGPDAYARAIERLLASPHYGEKMAQKWLDLARFGDTNGYQDDAYRSLWPYRDYVIGAFNANTPFDRFTLENLAGDLLPGAAAGQKIASGFNRNHRYNEEGGSDPEEFLVAYAVDRTNTTATVWLGLTLGCAQCHDHKYDPVSQKEYYQVYAFFNGLKGEVGVSKKPSPPMLKMPTADQKVRLERLDRDIAAAEKRLKDREPQVAAGLAAWEKSHAAPPGASAGPRPGLLVHYDFERDKGHHVADASGHGRHGLFINGDPQWIPGPLGQALKFDGDLVNVDLGPTGDFERTQPFSFACWFNAQGSDGTLLAKVNDISDSRQGYEIGLTDRGRVEVILCHDWPANACRVVTKEGTATDSWHHVLVTHDGTGKAAGLKVSLDGKPQPVEVAADGLSGSMRTEMPLFLGRKSESGAIKGSLDEVYLFDRALSASEATGLYDAALAKIVATAADKRSDAQKGLLRRHYLDRFDGEHRRLAADLARLRKESQDLDAAVTFTLIMEEPEQPRPAFVLTRGDFGQKADKVGPGVPAVLPPLPGGERPDRLTFARWLVRPDNPLVARVTVNRLWEQFFGAGLVRTGDDFGLRGELPSHPELLDWLATEFVASGWDIKALQRRIVLSATYRQSAAATDRAREADPYNRLMSRGARFRLSAEEIRDGALAAGGLLARRLGGPSVRPYQPEGYFQDKSSDWKWEASEGDGLYRRGLYTYWQRTTPYPPFQVFDAPTRELCAVDRPRTNTPLQALVTLNDPAFVEAARVFGQRVMTRGGGAFDDRLVFAFRSAVARRPTDRERQVLRQVYDAQLRRFRADPKAALALASNGRAPRPPGLDVPELAAWTAVGNVLLNLDETITRE